MSLVLYGPNVSDDKNGYFGGRGNQPRINHVAMVTNLQMVTHSIKHYLKQF